MNLTKRYKWSLVTSYGVLLMQILSAALSIPLALSYLDRELFGVWMLIGQIFVFYQLIDVGFSEAFVRLLIEFKERGPDSYAKGVKTALVVFCCQGLLVLIASAILIPLLPEWLALPARHTLIFKQVMLAQAVVFAGMNIFRIFDQILFAAQRLDVSNLANIVATPVSLLGIWLGLVAGWGIWSMFVGGLVLAAVLACFRVVSCHRLGLWKREFLTASFDRDQFVEIFTYGKDRFLATMGDRSLRVVPGFLITRFLGLEANGAWAVAQRVVMLAEQLLSKPVDMAYTFLARMYIGGDGEALNRRYSQLVKVVAASVGIAACGIATGLSPLVEVWTGGEIYLGFEASAAFALWFVAVMVKRTLWPAVTIPKDMGWTRVTNLIDLGALSLAAVLFFNETTPLWAFVLLLSLVTFGSSVPYMLSRAKSFPESGECVRLGMRYLPLVVGVFFAFAGWFSQERNHGGHLVFQFIVAVLSTLLAAILSFFLNPELRRWAQLQIPWLKHSSSS